MMSLWCLILGMEAKGWVLIQCSDTRADFGWRELTAWREL
jgi:hypothetical protein